MKSIFFSVRRKIRVKTGPISQQIAAAIKGVEMTTANVFALVLATFILSGLDGCWQQESKLDTKDDEACREAVTKNPQLTYEDCRREATAKRNAPQAKQQANY
jgi:hypothetical protein